MTAYEMRISDWSSDVCSSDLPEVGGMATVFALKQGHWGLVAVYLWSFEDVGEQPFAERCHQPGQLTGPADHHIALDLHPLAAQDHRLALPGLMHDEAAEAEGRDREATERGKGGEVRERRG